MFYFLFSFFYFVLSTMVRYVFALKPSILPFTISPTHRPDFKLTLSDSIFRPLLSSNSSPYFLPLTLVLPPSISRHSLLALVCSRSPRSPRAHPIQELIPRQCLFRCSLDCDCQVAWIEGTPAVLHPRLVCVGGFVGVFFHNPLRLTNVPSTFLFLIFCHFPRWQLWHDH